MDVCVCDLLAHDARAQARLYVQGLLHRRSHRHRSSHIIKAVRLVNYALLLPCYAADAPAASLRR